MPCFGITVAIDGDVRVDLLTGLAVGVGGASSILGVDVATSREDGGFSIW